MVQPIELNLAPFTPKGVRELNQWFNSGVCRMHHAPCPLGAGLGQGASVPHTRRARVWLYNNLKFKNDHAEN